MKKLQMIHALWLTAIVSILCGATMTYFSATQMKTVLSQYEKKLGDVREIQSILKEYRSYMAARRAYEELPGKHPKLLTDLVDVALIGPRTKISPMKLGEESSLGGWTVLRYQVDFGEVPTEMSKIATLIQQAEQREQPPACPPWQLVDCHIWSSPQQAGYAGATLVFEALDKSN